MQRGGRGFPRQPVQGWRRPWLPPIEQLEGRLPALTANKLQRTGKVVCCCSSPSSLLAWDCCRTKLGDPNPPAFSERPYLSLSAAVASQAPRKVLGSSTFVTNSSSSSRKAENKYAGGNPVCVRPTPKLKKASGNSSGCPLKSLKRRARFLKKQEAVA